jgi:hypothetical protein
MAQRLVSGNPNRIVAIIDHATAVTKGDMLKVTAVGDPEPIIRVTAATDNDLFYAIADADHPAVVVDDGKVHSVLCIIPDPSCVWEYDVLAAEDLHQGMGLSIHDHHTLHRAATDHVALVVACQHDSMTVRCVFLIPPVWGGASQNVSFSLI